MYQMYSPLWPKYPELCFVVSVFLRSTSLWPSYYSHNSLHQYTDTSLFTSPSLSFLSPPHLSHIVYNKNISNHRTFFSSLQIYIRFSKLALYAIFRFQYNIFMERTLEFISVLLKWKNKAKKDELYHEYGLPLCLK